MIRIFAILLFIVPVFASAQSVSSSYATRDGRAGTVVITCPSSDNTFTAGPCPVAKPSPVTFAAPSTSAIVTPNTAVTVFAASSVATGCDFVNTGTAILYIDLTTTAAAGLPTSIPLQPGQSFHCPYPPAGAVSAVAAQAQSFVAIRY
ncbi:hypothetical protein [Acidisphaera sp. L21]|uniref:hypothetical protein n=1 Tax=Acidisphaera sp. L21 TaxID=1641851 RepID=UPI00131DD183|nr:hypothetical protein [Acidisphaera sp. L21]